jgi:hypothetical protein
MLAFISDILAQSFEKRMAHLALCGLGPVLNLGKQRRLNPYSAVRDLLRIGLCLADERLQAGAQILLSFRREAVVDLAGIDELAGLFAADVDAVPFVAVECEATSRAARKSPLPNRWSGLSDSGCPAPWTRRLQARSCRRA